ncbi:MAG: hypothetical protein JW768_11235 [Chitinispirillaceae bacterium]|nr:hypothetical protein [Chitinispirillaceae bacterium]
MKNSANRTRNRKAALFSSFEEENRAEYLRLAGMTPSQRLDEFVVLQKRVWGERWTKKTIKKIAAVELVSW